MKRASKKKKFKTFRKQSSLTKRCLCDECLTVRLVRLRSLNFDQRAIQGIGLFAVYAVERIFFGAISVDSPVNTLKYSSKFYCPMELLM